MNRRSKENHRTKAGAAARLDPDVSSYGQEAGRSRGVPTLVGIPFDGQSSYLRGAGDAPAKIREALACDASNQWTETGVDLGTPGIYEDSGDLVLREQNWPAVIEAGIGTLMERGKRPVSLGGDHSITYPL
jgi:Arginase/agmatinase/formimionoglutamate hydrolase, arginase family